MEVCTRILYYSPYTAEKLYRHEYRIKELKSTSYFRKVHSILKYTYKCTYIYAIWWRS